MSRRKLRSQATTCFMCDKISSSREHVPPLCFFPDKKDFPTGPDLRRNLITVPACDKHNLKKSGDDEYLLMVFSSNIENNPFAIRLFKTKIARAFKRRPWIAKTIYKDFFPVNVGGIQTGGFVIDRARIDKSIDSIAKGIYYHHFGRKFIGPSYIMSHSIFDVSSVQRNEINRALAEWKTFSHRALRNATKYGENSKIFFYQMVIDEEEQKTAIRLVFYEGVVFDVLLHGDIESNGNN